MYVRMDREHTYPVADQPGVTRTLPAGWVGDVDDDVGAKAVEVGAAFDMTPKAEKKTRAET